MRLQLRLSEYECVAMKILVCPMAAAVNKLRREERDSWRGPPRRTSSHHRAMAAEYSVEEGFVRVCVRVRPLGEDRAAQGQLQVDLTKATIVVGPSEKDEHHKLLSSWGYSRRSATTFKFESVYESEDNDNIFQAVGRPLVESVLVGYNGTLFACACKLQCAHGCEGGQAPAAWQACPCAHRPKHTRPVCHAQMVRPARARRTPWGRSRS